MPLLELLAVLAPPGEAGADGGADEGAAPADPEGAVTGWPTKEEDEDVEELVTAAA